MCIWGVFTEKFVSGVALALSRHSCEVRVLHIMLIYKISCYETLRIKIDEMDLKIHEISNTIFTSKWATWFDYFYFQPFTHTTHNVNLIRVSFWRDTWN